MRKRALKASNTVKEKLHKVLLVFQQELLVRTTVRFQHLRIHQQTSGYSDNALPSLA